MSYGPPTPAHAALTPTARIQAMLDVEAALAEALAAEGLIPASCVPPITAAARAELYDTGVIEIAAVQAGNAAIPLIEMLTARVAAADPAAARYVHWGATSQDILDSALVLQFGGAAGTLAALGGRGIAVTNALGARLDLRVPDLPWHAERDRLVDLAAALGITAGTLGKIARDIALMSQTEINEAHEAPVEGRGGSSSMPQKRNPVAASIALAAAVRAPGLVATMLAAMPQEHERGLGGWQAEWDTLPELIRVVAGAAASLGEALDSLVVRPESMAANLALTGGLPNAEAVSIALAGHVGVRRAQQIVAAACREAGAKSRPLADVLKEDSSAMAHLTPAEVDALLVPDRYLGMARTFVERVLTRFDNPAAADA